MAELAACHTGTETVVADTDRIVLEFVCEVVAPLRNCSNEDADALVRAKRLDVILDTHHRCIETQSDLPAVGRQVISDRVFDDLQQLLLGIRGANGESMEQLNHKAGEPLKRSGNADCWADLNQNAFGSLNVNLELSGLVDGRVEKREEALRTQTDKQPE